MVILRDDQRAAAQRRDGQVRDGRWTLPRRSAVQPQPACSRCAGGGQPRALPRGIVSRSYAHQASMDGGEYFAGSFLDFGVIFRAADRDLEKRADIALELKLYIVLRESLVKRGLKRRDKLACNPSVRLESVTADFYPDFAHFVLLNFQPRCAADVVIIEHDALLVKNYFKYFSLNLRGGFQPFQHPAPPHRNPSVASGRTVAEPGFGAVAAMAWQQTKPIKENPVSPNDILIRLTKTDDGRTVREILLLVNDDSMVAEMQRTAEFLGKCLEMFDKSDAAVEYAEALQFAEGLARPNPRIKLLNS